MCTEVKNVNYIFMIFIQFLSLKILYELRLILHMLLPFSGIYTSQYCNPNPKQSTQETEMRPLGQTVNYPSDTTIVARGFYTPSLTQNTDNKDSVTEDSNSSDISQQLVGNIYRNPRPLPPVPQ